MLNTSIRKKINKLHQKKYRQEFGEFLVEGIKGVKEALAFPADVLQLIVEEKRKEETGISEIINLCIEKNVPIYFAAQSDIGTIKTTDVFSGVMAVVKIKDIGLSTIQDSSPVLVLDQINDPGNLGTIIRTAHWFGIKNILLSEGTVDPYNDKVVRSTMGSIFHINVHQSKNILEDVNLLDNEGYRIVALDLDGDNINDIAPDSKSVYILGSESHGISEELKSLANKVYTIPGGETESLNVAIAAGILMSKL